MSKLLLFVFIFNAMMAYCQTSETIEDNSDIFKMFGNDAFMVTIKTIMQDDNKSEPWEKKETKYTIPGTAITAKLVGSNFVINISLTPYLSRNNQLTIIAQQQTWIRNARGEIKYETMLNTFSIKFGEVLVFYPMGRNVNGKAPILIETVIYKKNFQEVPDKNNGSKPDTKLPSKESVEMNSNTNKAASSEYKP